MYITKCRIFHWQFIVPTFLLTVPCLQNSTLEFYCTILIFNDYKTKCSAAVIFINLTTSVFQWHRGRLVRRPCVRLLDIINLRILIIAPGVNFFTLEFIVQGLSYINRLVKDLAKDI